MAEYIRFQLEAEPTVGRRTRIWSVRSISSGEPLGLIRWYAPWRQYTFQPPVDHSTIFNPSCLDTIGRFCREATREHRGRG